VPRIFVRKVVMKLFEPAKKKGHWGIRTHKKIKDIIQREQRLKNVKIPSY
jgi:hypothetical protein